MEWVRENWVFILIFIFFIAMHRFGGGCMGGHGRHGEEEGHNDKGRTGEEATEKREKKGGHGCC